MDEVLARHSLPFVRPEQPGRGVLRVKQIVAVLGWIREEARAHCAAFES
jgi:hypothetical protein